MKRKKIQTSTMTNMRPSTIKSTFQAVKIQGMTKGGGIFSFFLSFLDTVTLSI